MKIFIHFVLLYKFAIKLKLKPLTSDKCNKNLGISDYRIRDDQMSASSAYDNDFATFGAHRARLNLTSWPPGYRANNEPPGTFLWLKVNLDQAMAITGISTQGYGNSSAEEWVSMYMMLYEKGDGLPFFTEIDGESLKVGVTMLFLCHCCYLI